MCVVKINTNENKRIFLGDCQLKRIGISEVPFQFGGLLGPYGLTVVQEDTLAGVHQIYEYYRC